MSTRPDELHDSEKDLEAQGPLGEYLRICREELLPRYRKDDQAALAAQSRHRWVARLTGAFGAATLTVAGYNIALEPSTRTLALEALLAAAAFVLVLVGLIAEWHEQWLTHRYRAEQLRLIKFRFLADPEFWCEGVGSPTSRARFDAAIRRIESVEEDQLPALAEDEPVPSLPSDASCDRLDEKLREQIIEYYRRKRLDFQIGYFGDRVEEDARRWYEKRRLLPAVFFISAAFAVAHAGLEIAERRQPRVAEIRASGSPADSRPSRLPNYLLAVSLWIPGLWAGIRTYRSANEFGRNRSRSMAKRGALSRVGEHLRPDAPAADAFSDMGLCEYILACDQGEWLRLMKEAEWYG